MQRKRKPFWERYDALVDRKGPDECWIWKSAKVNGYGVFTVEKGFMVKAHRLAYEREFGPIRPGYMCLHDNSCVSRACVNPAHLRQGTNADNMSDLMKSGRARALSEDEAKALVTCRDAGDSWSVLKTKFGLSPPVLRRAYERAKKGDFGGANPLKIARQYTKVTPEMKAEMKRLVDDGVAVVEVGRRFNVHGKTVRTYCGLSKLSAGRPKLLHS